MKYIHQFAVIILLSFTGEILHHFIPLPIPASIYGLVLMLAGLTSGIIPLHAVEDASRFLIEIMPLMFIPAGAGLLDSWGLLKPMLIPFLIISLCSTIIVMAVTGRITQWVIRFERKRKENHHE